MICYACGESMDERIRCPGRHDICGTCLKKTGGNPNHEDWSCWKCKEEFRDLLARRR